MQNDYNALDFKATGFSPFETKWRGSLSDVRYGKDHFAPSSDFCLNDVGYSKDHFAPISDFCLDEGMIINGFTDLDVGDCLVDCLVDSHEQGE